MSYQRDVAERFGLALPWIVALSVLALAGGSRLEAAAPARPPSPRRR